MIINPRDAYITAYSKHTKGSLHSADYFNSTAMYIGGADPKIIKTLELLLDNTSKVNKDLVKAYEIYKNIRTRIYLEGLLLNFSLEDVAKIPEIDLKVLEYYINYFFDTTNLKEHTAKTYFASCIFEPSARTWFNSCSTRTIDDIIFRMTGKSEKKEVRAQLEEAFNKLISTGNTFITTDIAKLEKFYNSGIFKEEQSVFDVGFKAISGAVKIANLLLRFEEGKKEDFLASWNIDIETIDVDDFENGIPEDQRLEVETLMNETNPIKSATASIDPDAALFSEE